MVASYVSKIPSSRPQNDEFKFISYKQKLKAKIRSDCRYRPAQWPVVRKLGTIKELKYAGISTARKLQLILELPKNHGG